MDILFLTGPPFGAPLFDAVIERLGRGSAESVVDAQNPSADWQAFGDRLAERVRARPTVVVAHGLAVPGAVAAALAASPAALVLMNGPVRALDPISGAASRVAASALGERLARTVLHPVPWLAWLRSSAGLRRAVVNPYVMDRDTVAAICGPIVEHAANRRAVVSWLAGLGNLPDPRSLRCPTLSLWGDGDALYPSMEAGFLEAAVPGHVHVAIPGGQHLHPVERPWESADRLRHWLIARGLWA